MDVKKANFKNLNSFIPKALKLLKTGKVIICPTDTVYGLVANAANEKAVKKIFKIKKREKGKPIPIFVKDIEMAKKLALIGEKQEKFLKKVWPGKVTAVLKRKKNCGLPAILFGGKKTIGLRIPNYRLVNELLKRLNKPLTGTSANISGKPALTGNKEVLEQFENQKDKPDLFLDAGSLPKSFPSKVIDLTKDKIKILRK